MMSAHARVAKNTLRRLFSAPLSGLLNIIVIGIALSLPAGLYALLQNAQGLLARASASSEISLFLTMDASSDDIASLKKQLAQNPAIGKIIFISRANALKDLAQSNGLNDVIAGLESNPLPDAFVISPKTTHAQELDNLRNELQKLPHVDFAQLDTAWVYKLEAILEFTRILVLILAVLLSLALIAITFNTIRLQIMTQKDEIQVAKLIGATNSFVRRPFLYFGAMQGILGGITAWAIIASGMHLLKKPISTLSHLYGSDFTLHPLSLGDSLTLMLFSLYLGLMGAWLSVSRHLSEIEPR